MLGIDVYHIAGMYDSKSDNFEIAEKQCNSKAVTFTIRTKEVEDSVVLSAKWTYCLTKIKHLNLDIIEQ